MNGKLFIMCGIPGSGKTTWVKNHIDLDHQIWVSRDEIRLNFLKKDTNKEYFGYENQTILKYLDDIVEGLSSGLDVFADATQTTSASRKFIISSISQRCKPKEIICVWINTPLDIALSRNRKRKGLRCVPEKDIKRMSKLFMEPSVSEGFNSIYKVIYNFKEVL